MGTMVTDMVLDRECRMIYALDMANDRLVLYSLALWRDWLFVLYRHTMIQLPHEKTVRRPNLGQVPAYIDCVAINSSCGNFHHGQDY